MTPVNVFLLTLLTVIFSSSAFAAESREALIARQLDCMDQKLKAGQTIDWDDICSGVAPGFADTYNYSDSSAYQAPSTLPVRKHTYEVAAHVEGSHYRAGHKSPYYYTNTLGIPVPDRVTKAGTTYGFYVAKTWNPYGPVQNWGEIFKKYEIPNFIKVELEGAMGKTDYSSYVTGKLKGYEVWDIEGRVLAGYDIVMNNSTLITPYIGFGYRRMEDKTGGWVDFIINDYAEFTNSKSYFYLPVGVETLTKFNDEWDINLKLEGNIVLYGASDYHLNETPGPYPGIDLDTNEPIEASFLKTSSDLRGGFGFRTSAKFIRKFNSYDFYLEPFFRVLYFNKNKETQLSAHSVDNGKDYVSAFPDGSPYKALWDEENYTTVVGLRSGIQF